MTGEVNYTDYTWLSDYNGTGHIQISKTGGPLGGNLWLISVYITSDI